MITRIGFKGADEAAAAVGVSRQTIMRALANTDPTVYPPPLTPDGRHGRRGSWAFTDETLRAWVRSLETFDTDDD